MTTRGGALPAVRESPLSFKMALFRPACRPGHQDVALLDVLSPKLSRCRSNCRVVVQGAVRCEPPCRAPHRLSARAPPPPPPRRRSCNLARAKSDMKARRDPVFSAFSWFRVTSALRKVTRNDSSAPCIDATRSGRKGRFRLLWIRSAISLVVESALAISVGTSKMPVSSKAAPRRRGDPAAQTAPKPSFAPSSGLASACHGVHRSERGLRL